MAELLHLLCIPDVQNQGVILRPPLGLKNLRYGAFIQAIGAQTINRFGGNRHQLSPADQLSGDSRRLIV